MERIEDVLAHVNDLIIGLSAEITVQEEIREPRYEEVPERQGGTSSDHDRGGMWFEKVQERATAPDILKRADSRAELLQVYDSCPFYSGRYLAARGLRLKREKLNSQILEWTSDLSSKLNSTKIEIRRVKVGEHEEPGELYTPSEWPGRDGEGQRRPGEMVEDYENKPFSVIDNEVRMNSLKDLIELSKFSNSDSVKGLIKECYSRNDSKEVRVNAGRALGYYRPRIWVHENRLLTTLGVVAAASAVGAMIYQYLSR